MRSLIVLLAAISLMTVGCAKEKHSPEPAPAEVVDIPDEAYVPPGSGPGSGPGTFDGVSFPYGGTATLTLEGTSQASKDELMSEFFGRSMPAPENMAVNLNFVKKGNRWKGNVTTLWDEGSNYRLLYFDSGITADAVENNLWFEKNGDTVFHAVLEDYVYGAVVVVIDDIIDLGDGNGPEDTVGGSVWFKVYKNLDHPWIAPHPPSHCWNVSLGPYDCRPWPSGDGNNPTASVNPSLTSSNPEAGYKLLGRFEGLSLQEAFNGEFEF